MDFTPLIALAGIISTFVLGYRASRSKAALDTAQAAQATATASEIESRIRLSLTQEIGQLRKDVDDCQKKHESGKRDVRRLRLALTVQVQRTEQLEKDLADTRLELAGATGELAAMRSLAQEPPSA